MRLDLEVSWQRTARGLPLPRFKNPKRSLDCDRFSLKVVTKKKRSFLGHSVISLPLAGLHRRRQVQFVDMKLTVKTLKGSHFEIRVLPTDTVSSRLLRSDLLLVIIYVKSVTLDRFWNKDTLKDRCCNTNLF